VILVHGAAESADTWNRVGPLLARNHRVYAYDIVGWGYTQRTGRYSVDDEVRQLLGFIAALGLDRPILVGHSSGAAAVALAALREPSQVGAVMFLDGDALSTGAGAHSPTSALIVDPYRTTLIRLVLGSDGLIRSIYDRQCGPTCPVLDAAGVDVWRRPMEVPGAERALWSMLALGVPGLPQSRLAALALLPLPKAVVFGADDAVFSPDTAITTAARIGAPAPTVITGGRHLTLISHPAEVGAAVEALAARR
jgi:pimeloyl-ACP methyl ester carboxylesterase